MQRTRNYMVGSESRWQLTVRGNRDSKATKLLLTKKSIESVKLRLRGVSQCAGMQGHVWATKVLGLKCLPRTLEHQFDCARHDRAAADPEDREASIPKILVPSVITKEHETVRSDQQFPINLLTHLFGPAPHHYASVRRRPATTRSAVAVASPARTRSTICATVKPCASMTVSVQPSRDAASNSSARVGHGGAPRSSASGSASSCSSSSSTAL